MFLVPREQQIFGLNTKCFVVFTRYPAKKVKLIPPDLCRISLPDNIYMHAHRECGLKNGHNRVPVLQFEVYGGKGAGKGRAKKKI